MSTSNALRKPAPERLANHMAAPITASFVAAMRQAFCKIEVTHVSEGSVHLGAPTLLTDVEMVSYSVPAKGKKEIPPIQYSIGRSA